MWTHGGGGAATFNFLLQSSESPAHTRCSRGLVTGQLAEWPSTPVFMRSAAQFWAHSMALMQSTDIGIMHVTQEFRSKLCCTCVQIYHHEKTRVLRSRHQQTCHEHAWPAIRLNVMSKTLSKHIVPGINLPHFYLYDHFIPSICNTVGQFLISHKNIPAI